MRIGAMLISSMGRRNARGVAKSMDMTMIVFCTQKRNVLREDEDGRLLYSIWGAEEWNDWEWGVASGGRPRSQAETAA